MRTTIALSILILCAALLTAAGKGTKAPSPGITHVYIERATQEMVPAVLAKGLRVAILFDPAQMEWLKGIVPSLKGTSPLIFVRGDLKPEETAALRKLLDPLNYEVMLLHAKATAGDSVGGVPVEKMPVIERVVNLDHGWVDYELQYGAGKPERAVMQSKEDKDDLGVPFTVAGGMIFKRSKVCLVNIDRPGASLPKGMDLTVVFSADPGKMKKILGL